MRFVGAVLLRVCWGAWAAVWVGGWLYNLTKGPRTRSRVRTPEMILAGVAILIGLIHWAIPASFWTATALSGPWPIYVGAVLLIGSTVFTIWARVVLGRMWSSSPGIKEGHALRTDGPYAVTRHPVYSGMLGMVLGSALLTGRWWGLSVFVLFAAYVAAKVHVEERLLLGVFGERYTAYQGRTPQIVPGWRWQPGWRHSP